MQLESIREPVADELRRLDSLIVERLASDVVLVNQVSQYIVGGGGKRLRPLSVLLVARACGYAGDQHVDAAAIIEFIHTATLLHDDVIDEADTRRGKSSANCVWGNAASVLVGDFLYSKSFRLLTEYGNLDIIRLLSATTNTMSEGEVFQLVKRGDVDITEADYLSIIDKKTAVLISAACALGGHLGEAMDSRIEALTHFGLRVGAAFQMTDDTLDYMAKEEDFGKAIGKDLEEGKLTLPLIRTMGQCSEEEKERLRELLGREERDGEAIGTIMALMHRYDGISYTLGKAKALIAEAKSILSSFPDSTPREALLAVADYVIEREI